MGIERRCGICHGDGGTDTDKRVYLINTKFRYKLWLMPFLLIPHYSNEKDVGTTLGCFNEKGFQWLKVADLLGRWSS